MRRLNVSLFTNEVEARARGDELHRPSQLARVDEVVVQALVAARAKTAARRVHLDSAHHFDDVGLHSASAADNEAGASDGLVAHFFRHRSVAFLDPDFLRRMSGFVVVARIGFLQGM
jgi:hypothetical protein